MESNKNNLHDMDSISNRINWYVLRETNLKGGTFIPQSIYVLETAVCNYKWALFLPPNLLLPSMAIFYTIESVGCMAIGNASQITLANCYFGISNW